MHRIRMCLLSCDESEGGRRLIFHDQRYYQAFLDTFAEAHGNPNHDYKATRWLPATAAFVPPCTSDVGGTPAGMSAVELRLERAVENHVWNSDRESTPRVRCKGCTSVAGTWQELFQTQPAFSLS